MNLVYIAAHERLASASSEGLQSPLAHCSAVRQALPFGNGWKQSPSEVLHWRPGAHCALVRHGCPSWPSVQCPDAHMPLAHSESTLQLARLASRHFPFAHSSWSSALQSFVPTQGSPKLPKVQTPEN